MLKVVWQLVSTVVLAAVAWCVVTLLAAWIFDDVSLADRHPLNGRDLAKTELMLLADEFLALVEVGEGQAAVDRFGDPDCFDEPADVEALASWQRGFEFVATSVTISEESARVSGNQLWDEPAYGHRAGVDFTRVADGAQWRVCWVGLTAGYS